MKLLLSMFIVLLLVLPQEFVEASDSTTLDSLSTIKEGDVGEVAALQIINCEFLCSRKCLRRDKECESACRSCCRTCHCVFPVNCRNHAAYLCYVNHRINGRKCP